MSCTSANDISNADSKKEEPAFLLKTGYFYQNEFILLSKREVVNFWKYNFQIQSDIENIRIESCSVPDILLVRGESTYNNTTHQLISFLKIDGDKLVLSPSIFEFQSSAACTVDCSPRLINPDNIGLSICPERHLKTSAIVDLNPKMFL
ncbi:hypothetical protein [Phaeocystidibacter luteus]|uniref:Uncharacterized protein n=1 Tax=Phaeocystidibacter luteus TaxID=911197 RepID=A0A6N6RH30_9FLAO|nr:hypothetical protein [Phaeocystidibacter luteus]KAB2813689.1 hypothetical protein F8C67_05890 [Phaeocystidibacter luteus]